MFLLLISIGYIEFMALLSLCLIFAVLVLRTVVTQAI